MDFTREPIIETIITPREGCKLVVRNSKNSAQEEYFVDAVEVVSFGTSFFFRSLERPKSFLVPASEYEVLEAREARMVLKNVGSDRTVKIAGGKLPAKAPKEAEVEKEVPPIVQKKTVPEAAAEAKGEERFEKKRDRRRNYRRRRGKDELTDEPMAPVTLPFPAPEITPPTNRSVDAAPVTQTIISSLLPPPSSLISDSIIKYREQMESFATRSAEGEGESSKPAIEKRSASRRGESVEEKETAPVSIENGERESE